ncbi:MAG: glycine oxidase ThiO [Bryobacteraceae bacterium]
MRRVVVIGAGIIGSSVAWRLVQRGFRVRVFDPGGKAGQASWAAAGMLAPGAEVGAASAWSDLALEGARLYPEFVAELGGKIDYRHCGALELAYSDSDCEELAARRMRQAEIGIVARDITFREARLIAPALEREPRAAVYYGGDGLVDPRDVVARLHERIAVEQRPVRYIRVSGETVSVGTPERAEPADAVVLAAGPWTSSIQVLTDDGSLPLPASFPVRGHLLGYRVEPGLVGPIIRHDHTYILQRRSGLLIVGASSEEVGFDSEIDAGTVAELHARAETLLPALFRGRVPEPWLGFRPGIAADGPLVGRLGETPVWTAYGHYRNGVLMAPSTAARIADSITASLGTG